MNTQQTASRPLDAAARAQHVVVEQFDQVATLIREIAKIEAMARQADISEGLKEILHHEAAAAYERLKTIREWTDGEIGRLLATATAPAAALSAGQAATEGVDFAALTPREWEELPLATRLAIQEGRATVEQSADAKEKIRRFRRKVASFGKPYAELTERQRMQLRWMSDPKKGD
jgi:hypothetical protein